MSDNKNKIVFLGEEGEEITFSVIEQTKVNGHNYLLVTEDDMTEDEEEGVAYILKDVSKESDTESVYVMLEDDNEIDAVGRVFSELLEDFDIE